jgi:hypothetical protein
MSVHRAVESLSRGDIAGFISAVKDLVDSSIKSVENAYANAVDMVTTGLAMIADDILDFGKLDRPHHWLWGLILVVVGIVVLLVVVVLLFSTPR